MKRKASEVETAVWRFKRSGEEKSQDRRRFNARAGRRGAETAGAPRLATLPGYSIGPEGFWAKTTHDTSMKRLVYTVAGRCPGLLKNLEALNNSDEGWVQVSMLSTW